MGILPLPGKAPNETVSLCAAISILVSHLGSIMAKSVTCFSAFNITTICLNILRKFKTGANLQKPSVAWSRN